MKRIVVTQRVDIIKSFGERRDSVDQRWTDFLLSCEIKPFFLPNNLQFVQTVLDNEKIDGVLLTGGNSLVKYGGDAPERDGIEKFLLQFAIKHRLPLAGVCRGMQVIQDYFGVGLVSVSDHVATRHRLTVAAESRHAALLNDVKQVNAFHRFGAYDSVPNLFISARSTDNIVMAVEHTKYPLFGQMWHSEREYPFSEKEIVLFKKYYNIISCP